MSRTRPLSARGAGPFRRRHPAQLVVGAFLLAVAVGTILLWLPPASEGPGAAPFLTALFTSTSAVCVTGLVVVDTAGYWSTYGEVVILLLIQLGGFGIMTMASLLALFVYRNLGVRGKVLAQAETKAIDLGDVKRVLIGVAIFSFIFEVVASISLTARLATGYDEPLGRAVYHGVFHGVSAFNNAGFIFYDDGLIGFVTDPWFTLTIGLAVILGSLGFPVLLELWRERSDPSKWSLHTKLTLAMTFALLALGTAMVMGFEWTNPRTLGGLSSPSKLLAGFFQGLTPRSGGFHSLDYSGMRETTWFGTILLMFIGGGSASAAGGVKVTTVALLGAMILAEARGDDTVNLMGRRIPGGAQRQALSVVVVSATVIALGTLFLMASGTGDLAPSLFEAVSAFGTVGLSTGITPELSDGARFVVVVLMFVGRVGPITLGAALAMREHRRLFRYPEERPIVG